jgi:hypothetical protein
MDTAKNPTSTSMKKRPTRMEMRWRRRWRRS